MKRLFIILLVLGFVLSNMSAANPEGNAGSSTSLDTPAYVKVALSLGSSTGEDDPGEKVEVGFSTTEVINTLENIKEPNVTSVTDNSISLTPDNTTSTASLETPLYAYWSIQSGKALKVSIYGSGPLTLDTSNTINWKVAKSDESKVYFGGTGDSNVSYAASDASVLYTHKTAADGGTYGNAGSVKLAITTAPYALKKIGDYSAYLYIKVSDN